MEAASEQTGTRGNLSGSTFAYGLIVCVDMCVRLRGGILKPAVCVCAKSGPGDGDMSLLRVITGQGGVSSRLSIV